MGVGRCHGYSGEFRFAILELACSRGLVLKPSRVGPSDLSRDETATVTDEVTRFAYEGMTPRGQRRRTITAATPLIIRVPRPVGPVGRVL